MTHEEFNAAFRAGRVRVDVERKLAAQLVSGRMLLPVFLLPVLGIAIALALVGHWIAGLALFVAAFGFRQMVRNTAPGFVLRQALADAAFYNGALRNGVMTVTVVEAGSAAHAAQNDAPGPSDTTDTPRT